jgi:TonB family protein
MNTAKLTFFALFFLMSAALSAQLAPSQLMAEVDETEIEKKSSPTISSPAAFSAASFPGGPQQLMAKLSKAVAYPDLAREYAVEGTVVVMLKLNRRGKVTERKIVKGLGFGCDEAVLAALDRLPNWNPARAAGKRVDGIVYVPMKFRLR